MFLFTFGHVNDSWPWWTMTVEDGCGLQMHPLQWPLVMIATVWSNSWLEHLQGFFQLIPSSELPWPNHRTWDLTVETRWSYEDCHGNDSLIKAGSWWLMMGTWFATDGPLMVDDHCNRWLIDGKLMVHDGYSIGHRLSSQWLVMGNYGQLIMVSNDS